MEETELHRRMCAELEELLSDLRNGLQPSNGELNEAVAECIHRQLSREEKSNRRRASA